MIDKVDSHFGNDLEGKTIAIWGLAFKPRTDDIREAPALVLMDHLLEKKAMIQVHDPEAMPNVKAIYGDRVQYCDRHTQALDEADALVIMTEWSDYKRPNWEKMTQLMRSPTIFDGRNLYDPHRMKERGFCYHSVGRPSV